MNGRAEALPHYIEVINTYAGRCVREDFIEAILRQFPDFVKENPDYGDELLKATRDLSAKQEKKYVDAVCGEFSSPLFDYQIDANTVFEEQN